MRILCLYLPRLAADLAVRHKPNLEGRPLVIVTGAGDEGLVAAVSSHAAAAGVVSGMPAGEARQRCAHALFLSDNATACLDELDRVAAIISTRTTPLVEAGGRDHLLVDLAGTAHLFADESAAASRIAGQVRTWADTDLRAGVASSRQAALRAARLAHHLPVLEESLCAAGGPAIARFDPTATVSAATRFASPLDGSSLEAALAALAARADLLLADRSFREACLELATPAGTVASRVRPPQPLHGIAATLWQLMADARGGATAARLTLRRLGPNVDVHAAEPPATARAAPTRRAPRARQLLLRAAG